MAIVIKVSERGMGHIDYLATVSGVKGVFGAGKGPLEAIGGCVRTAASLSVLTGFSMPSGFGEKTDIERGADAMNGFIPGVTVRNK